MNDMKGPTENVSALITKLCGNIAKQNGIEDVKLNAAIRTLKAKTFEILLHKSKHSSSVHKEDVQQRAKEHIIAAKANIHKKSMLKGNNRQHERTSIAELEERLAELFSSSFFTEGCGQLIVHFLFLLKNSDKDDVVSGNVQSPRYSHAILVPEPFILHVNQKNNHQYTDYVDVHSFANELLHPNVRFFKSVADIRRSKNPYLPKSAFMAEAKSHMTALERKCSLPKALKQIKSQTCGLNNVADQLFGKSMRIDVGPFRLFSTFGNRYGDKQFNTIFSNEKEPLVNDTTLRSVPICSESRVNTWNWESLGKNDIALNRPFVTEANVPLELGNYAYSLIGFSFEAKIVNQQKFIDELKSIAVGIQSEIFQYDENYVFYMTKNITVNGLLPTTVKSFVGDFLECGSCYKRLQTMILKKNYKHIYPGFMFKALCGAVDEYLLCFQQFVFSCRDDGLIALHKRLGKIMNQISNLCNVLGIHHRFETDVGPPFGAFFLSYLYREITRVTEKDFTTLLMFILKQCCHVYFKHLQKWIFHGLLDDPNQELCIGFTDHYLANTKYFYDKAYFVRKDSVPGFFHNFEEQLLQCGKYTMLLKAYNPTHPIFDLKYPNISVCLTFAEIEKLQADCNQYYDSARERCGKPITIAQIFESRYEQKRKFMQMVALRSRENMQKWSLQQQTKARELALKKRKRLQELCTQLEEARAHKVAKRRVDVHQALMYLRERERAEMGRDVITNINLRKRIEYYQELYDLMKENNIHINPRKIKSQPDHLHNICDEPIACFDTSISHNLQQTPNSASGSEFDLCNDGIDDDVEHKLKEPQYYPTINNAEDAVKTIKMSSTIRNNNNNINNVITAGKAGDIIVTSPLSLSIKMKRSISDMVNSNEVPEKVSLSSLPEEHQHNELVRIRNKVLSGMDMALCLNYTKNYANTEEVVVAVPTLTDAMMEAKLNKLRVMMHECGTSPSDAIASTDINLNPIKKTDELTEAQRNRQHILFDSNNTFSGLSRDPMAERAKLRLNLDTELARNRRKILQSEFDIITGDDNFVINDASLPSTSFELAPSTSLAAPSTLLDAPSAPMMITLDAGTPMSTTSDTPLRESYSDITNGNVVVDNVSSALKLNITLANKNASVDALDTTRTTADVEATPDCALNTAGLLVRHGFTFDEGISRKINANHEESLRLDAMSIDNVDDGTLHVDLPECDIPITPYKRCIELIENNFECSVKNSYMRLNKISKLPTEATISAKSQSNESLKQFNVHKMSVITLTEFLQASVIKPVAVHLELINDEVMRLILKDLHLLDHLRSLRHYFFLMDGEFGAKICEGIIGKLESGVGPQQLLKFQMLHCILDAAVGSSMAGHAKNTDNLSFIVKDIPKKFDLSSASVLDTLSLTYRVEWPLNLILTPEALKIYAQVFRYLIKVRRISWLLENAYLTLQEAVKNHGTSLLHSPQYRHVQQIRHKLYHFVHSLQNHITANALQSSWKTFKDDLLEAKCLEDIYRKHSQYIKRILFLCMLNRQSVDFQNNIENIFKLALRFCNNLKVHDFRQLTQTDMQQYYTHPRYDKMAADEMEFHKNIVFTIYLGNKIVKHGYQAEIGEFIQLIDYNQYYTEIAKSANESPLDIQQ